MSTIVIEMSDLSLPELTPYTDTSELRLKQEGIFIAESPKVIRIALDSGYEPVSLLTLGKYLEGQGRDIADRCRNVPIYSASAGVLEQLTGHKLTQGMLCAMKRGCPVSSEEVLRRAKHVAVLESVMNQTNIGAVFRSAAALGMDAVLLAGGCSDPLFRRTVRVSMGTVFMIPWAYMRSDTPEYVYELRRAGFFTAAAALRDDSVSIADERPAKAEKLALIFGTEGDGLPDATVDACDLAVRIPMSRGVDSLNVAAASAVAFWQVNGGKTGQ